MEFGNCPQCVSNNQQICDNQFQPGFTHWGSFAEYVALDYADTNLVRLPQEIDDVAAASLGCRFITSYRAVVDQGRVKTEEYVVIHGCGGVGLSAIMIAKAYGASKIVMTDVSDERCAAAKQLGADATVNVRGLDESQIVAAIEEKLGGLADVSIECCGMEQAARPAILVTKPQGVVAIVGMCHAEMKLPIIHAAIREIDLKGIFRYRNTYVSTTITR